MEASTSEESQLAQKSTSFPVLLVVGTVLGVVSIIACWALLGTEFGLSLLVLTVLLVIAAVAFRLITGQNRDPAASEEGGLPKQPLDSDRPLGDTSEAHDEINPHDLPLDNPGRHAAQRLAAGSGGTTRGNASGGATGRGGQEEGEGGLVGADEAGGASSS